MQSMTPPDKTAEKFVINAKINESITVNKKKSTS